MEHETLLFLPTHNEYRGVMLLVPQLLALEPPLDILIIDDGSTDGTAEWCQALARTEPRATFLQRGKRLGLGTANVAAMQHAVRAGYRYLVSMDADGSHDPTELDRLLDRIRSKPDCDVVIGSRYVGGGRILRWPWSRRITSRLVNLYARRFLRIPVADCSSGFRCYRVETLAKMDWSAIHGTGYEFYEQILYLLHQNDARFAEVPITFVERKAGASKASLQVKLQSAWALLRLGIRGRRSSAGIRSTGRGETTCYTGD
jgi:dolichol-phosphate mannosyltransferase